MKNHISTFSNLMLKYLIFAFFVGFGLLFFGCKSKEEVKPESEFVEIPDLNFEKYLIENKIDSIQDGKILRKNVINVTKLNLINYYREKNNEILNLQGLELFTNLQELDCRNHPLKKIDLSKNIFLKIVTVYNCQLNNLNLDDNTQLTELYCDGNKLLSLDMSKNIRLKKLFCSDNQLTNLNINKNIDLAVLWCQDNQLINLDLSNNINLTNFWCGNNKFTDLYVDKNIRLKELVCYFNELRYLDLRKNTSLYTLFSYSNKIKTICINNKYQVLDWYKDTFTTYELCP